MIERKLKTRKYVSTLEYRGQLEMDSFSQFRPIKGWLK
ncbi:hypothetical protein SAMN05216167_102211 [Spirosoma endophyticum]|uniref:Uncharacterized protein n=1 Tax=Spirosoma endophyticum TaxID=662367 RepID=A0A1I1LE34_9BACT|nr:hypothetical protein SAMN05216167_102211 [Spirosoma endophyticum]